MIQLYFDQVSFCRPNWLKLSALSHSLKSLVLQHDPVNLKIGILKFFFQILCDSNLMVFVEGKNEHVLRVTHGLVTVSSAAKNRTF